MKKIIVLILVFILCLSLSACGKSEAVKNVEAMIDALGEITIESIDAIRAAEDAYEVLMPEEQKKVKNYETLTTARDRYYELALVGEWCWSRVDLYDLTSNYDRVDMILNADMTGTDMIGTVQEHDVQWSVSDSCLKLEVEGEGGYFSFDVVEQDGKILVQIPDTPIEYIRRDDYVAMLDDAFLVVDTSKIALNEYFGFSFYENIEVDTWGEPTGHGDKRVRLTNRLYEQGWLYLNNDESFAIEVVYPEFHTETHHEINGTTYGTHEAGTLTLTGCPFTGASGQILWYIPDFTFVADLSVDQLSFGRAKGTITFINQKYVKEVKSDVDGQLRVLITEFSDLEYYSGAWYDDFQY